MKGLRFIGLALAVLVVATLACGGGGGDDTPTLEAPPTLRQQEQQEEQPTQPPTQPPPPPTPEPEPVEEAPALEITNSSGTDVWYIYVSPSDAEEWGSDWLGDNIIHDGESYTIVDIPSGHYDIKAEDENEEVIETWWNVDVDARMMWTIVGLASLEVVNDSPDTITDLFISPTEDTSWGDNWLTAGVIGPGETHTLDSLPRGTYDMRAADSEGDAIEMIYSVSLAGEKTWTVTGRTPLPDNAVLRFEEQFEDNRNNWGLDVEDEDVFYRRPADGEYCILIKREQFTAWEWYEPFRTDEFVAEVGCRMQGTDDATCGLGFGPDGDNLYWFEVSAVDQSFAIFLLENGQWQEKLIEWTTSVNIDPDGANTLSIERVSGIVSVFINGVFVGDVASDRFPTGRLGLGGSTYTEGGATVCLDNLRVWRLE